MTIQEYFGDWCNVLDIPEAERITKQLASSMQPVCPSVKNLFKAFSLCPRHNLRVVILGQDPYHNIHNNVPTATGIAFGNSPLTSENGYSPSLEVLKESVIDFTCPHGTITFDPSLEKWEEQGVLMLNSALSCIAGKPGSHALLWRPFMKSFLTSLSAIATGIIYVLMGTQAQSFEHCINPSCNYIFKINHPSWYARNKVPMPSTLWYTINTLLTGIYGKGIQWYKESPL